MSHRTDLFVKGPIPVWWLQNALALGFPALRVGLALWFQYGFKQSNPVKLSNAAVRLWGVDRYSKYRALKALEAAGLIKVQRNGNQSPQVEICTTRDRAP